MQVTPHKDHIGRRVEYKWDKATVIGYDKGLRSCTILFDDKSKGWVCKEGAASARNGGLIGEPGHMIVEHWETYTLLDDDTKGPVEEKLEVYFDGGDKPLMKRSGRVDGVIHFDEEKGLFVAGDKIPDSIPLKGLPEEILIQIINHLIK